MMNELYVTSRIRPLTVLNLLQDSIISSPTDEFFATLSFAQIEQGITILGPPSIRVLRVKVQHYRGGVQPPLMGSCALQNV